MAVDFMDVLLPDANDNQIAHVIATYLLNVENPAGPWHLAIHHDARKEPCPVMCDRIIHNRGLCAIERADKEICRLWIVKALKLGFTVERYVRRGYRDPVALGNIETVKVTLHYRAAQAALTPAQQEIDEEIPF